MVGLLGAEAHLPAETAHRLRELLPDAFTPLPPTDIDPTRLPLEDLPSRPMLKVYDGDVVEPEPAPAA